MLKGHDIKFWTWHGMDSAPGMPNYANTIFLKYAKNNDGFSPS